MPYKLSLLLCIFYMYWLSVCASGVNYCSHLASTLLFQGSFATTATAMNDGLGFKIIFASLAWQPLVSSIHVRYLLLHPRMFCIFTALSSSILFCECWSFIDVYLPFLNYTVCALGLLLQIVSSVLFTI